MRAVILISGKGSNLQAFIEQVALNKLALEIALVISNNPNAEGLAKARKAGIKTVCINHRDYDSRVEFDRAMQQEIEQQRIEMVILAGFMRILSDEFVSHYRNRLLNTHPSLLPKFKGTNTHQRALDANDQWHGVSIHFVEPELDAGPVIVQGRFKINADDTAQSLQQRVHQIEHQLYPLAVQWFIEKRLSIVDGKVLLDNEVSPQQLQTFTA